MELYYIPHKANANININNNIATIHYILNNFTNQFLLSILTSKHLWIIKNNIFSVITKITDPILWNIYVFAIQQYILSHHFYN